MCCSFFLRIKIKEKEDVCFKMKLNKEIKAILFDLDGTLLPMSQAYFIKQYFKRLAAYAATIGISPEALIDGTLAGTEAMISNDGKRTNRETFWNTYFEAVGEKRADLEELLDKFYFDGFKTLKEFTEDNVLAKKIVKLARGGDRKVVLATNPVFPMQAQIERLSWIGLSSDDFDLITSYDNSNYCKPNPQYYIEICKAIGVEPENCLMIGNDEGDDMKGASLAGMTCFLVTDHRIMDDNFMWTGARGSFEQVLKLIEKL